ncbi:glycoside hydrolase family 3 N-terminal domain-containing protein [Plantactinospora sp. B5E13]|uniref:glycoside hydrolase family 3 N-terminal domain-containing protein n=1 Tax=Plantactinospora sp. B5E13 TaxID=3153758 RepID=UPI00325C86A5
MKNPHLTRRLLLGAIGSAAVATGTAGCGSRPGRTPPPEAVATPRSPSPHRTTPGRTDEASLRRRIASLLVVGFRGEQLRQVPWVSTAIRDGLGGVILFDRDLSTDAVRNIRSRQQVTALVKSLLQAAPRLIVSVDQEGGRVARLNPGNGFPATKSQAQIGAENSTPATRSWAQGLVHELSSVGFTFNYAPVVDLNVNPNNPAIGRLDRSFSAKPDVVVKNATEEIQVHRAAGIRTSLKHFPGLGSATANTDFAVADVTDSWRPVELEPFQQLISAGTADSVLVGHVLNRQLDPNRPASLSRPVVTDLLRNRMGFRGPVVSDDMQAVAITSRFGRDEAVALALEAGVDLLVFGNQQVYDPNIVTETVNGVLKLVRSGRLTEARINESVARVDALRPKG